MSQQTIVLAFETTLPEMSATLIGSDGKKLNFFGDAKVSGSNQLLAASDSLLQQSKTDLSELELLAVCAGPGSFTGIRVGLATAKALAFGLGCEAYGISILEALALMASETVEADYRKIIAAVGGGRNQIYTQTFLLNEQGKIDYAGSRPQLINTAEMNAFSDLPETLIIADKRCACEINALKNNLSILTASDNVSEFIALRGLEILQDFKDQSRQDNKLNFNEKYSLKEENYKLDPIYLREFRIGQ